MKTFPERQGSSEKPEEPNLVEIEKREFTQRLKTLIGNKSRLLSVIQSRINQYGLRSCDITPESVLSDCYLRAIAAIEKGKKIINPEAWMITTARNIIRETTRKKSLEQREVLHLEKLDLEDINYKNGEYTEEDLENIEDIEAEIQKLDPLDRKIFLLRLEGKSFIAIADQLVRDGDYPHSDSLQNTVTKRCNRIKEKIRKKVLQKMIRRD
jgi:DNA-directed RNA polymerase specialized sigma24 family protein